MFFLEEWKNWKRKWAEHPKQEPGLFKKSARNTVWIQKLEKEWDKMAALNTNPDAILSVPYIKYFDNVDARL